MRALAAALRLLTIFPVPGGALETAEDRASSPAWFPVAGVLLGALLGGFCWAVGRSLPPWVAGVLVAIGMAAVSGCLHLDGLSDSADGLLSSRPRERVLEIMKDSHIGAMGAIALWSDLSMKAACVASLPEDVRWRAVAVAVVAGRSAMTLAISAVPYVREAGLGRDYCRRRSWPGSLAAVLIPAACAFGLLRGPGLVMIAIAGVVFFLFCLHCRRRIGGITGDTLGASCELAEISALVVAAGVLR